MSDNIQELYSLLRSADQKAQTGDQQAQADAQSIYNHIQHLEKTTKEQAASEYPPLVAGGVGEGLALTGKGAQLAYKFGQIPKAVQDIASSQQQHNQVLADLIKQNEMITDRGVAQPHGGGKWTSQLAGIAPTGSQMNEASLNRAQGMVGAIQPGGPAAGGSISPSGNIILPPDPKEERRIAMALREARVAEELKKLSIFNKITKGTKFVGELGGKALSKANPYFAFFSAPYEAADAYNKFNREDKVGGTLSTIGGLAGAASLYPPITVPAGALSLGAHGADWAYQEYLKRQNQPQNGYESQPVQYANGGLVFRK